MSRKKTNWRAPIAGGVAGAAFGMLAAALGDSMELLPGAAIGGVLGATAARFGNHGHKRPKAWAESRVSYR